MKRFYSALQSVIRFRIFPAEISSEPAPDWMLVLARCICGVLTAVLAGIILWFAPHDRLLAALLATFFVSLARYLLFPRRELLILGPLSELLSSPGDRSERGASLLQQGVFNILLLLRPLCIFFLLRGGNIWWLPAASALGMAVSATYGQTDKEERFKAWGVAAGVALFAGGILARVGAHPGMLLGAILAAVLCYLLPQMLEKSPVRLDRSGLLYAGEALALTVGLLGQAL